MQKTSIEVPFAPATTAVTMIPPYSRYADLRPCLIRFFTATAGDTQFKPCLDFCFNPTYGATAQLDGTGEILVEVVRFFV
jgi:hypothetical protein